MLNVTDATKTAYTSNSVPKALTIYFPNRNITFNNSDIKSESFTLTEAIEKESYLTFKGCIASQCKFQVADNVQDLRGEYVEISIKAGTTETIPLFKGYVDEQNNETHEDVITEFTCYDALYKIGSRNMQSWVDSRTYPITVRNFRNQLFSTLGITQESKTLINDSLTISANLKSFMDNPSATDLMKWICQLNAVYGQLGRDGQFKYRELKALSAGLYPSETTYPSPTTYPSDENAGTTITASDYITLEYEPYQTDFITKVAIMDVNGIDQGQAGTSGNTLVIQDNPIAFNVNMRTAARAILAKVDGINHIPVVKMKCVGMPYQECGDTYLSYTKRNVCRTYIFQRTLTGIQSLFDEYSSDTDKDFPPYKSTSTTRINSERKTVMDIQADIVNFKKITADEFEATNAKFNSLDANKITTGTLSVDRIGGKSIDATTKLKGSITNGNWGINFSSGTMSIGTLSANSITSGTIDANKITVKNIDGSQIKAGTISASSIAGGTITADQIKANTITAAELNISAGGDGWAVSFDKYGSNFSTGNLNCGNVKGSIGSANAGGWGVNFTNGTFNLGTVTANMISADTVLSKITTTTALSVGSISAQYSVNALQGMTINGASVLTAATGVLKGNMSSYYVQIGTTKYYLKN